MYAAAVPLHRINNMVIIETIIPLLILSVNAIWDIHRKEILLSPVLVMGAAGILYRFFYISDGIAGVFTSLMPGAFLLAASLLSGGRIGKGDALLALCLGEWTGLSNGIFVIFAGSAGAALAGTFLLINKKKTAEIPFVPFLLCGYILQMILMHAGKI